MPTLTGWDATVTPAANSGFQIGANTASYAAGAVNDVLQGFQQSAADKAQAAGDTAEAGEYALAETEAQTNAVYAKTNEQISGYQQDRTNFQSMGTLRADVGGAGFADAGTALYLAMDSARQGSLAKAATIQQGQINIQGYEEQATSYADQEAAATQAADAAQKQAKDAKKNGIIAGIGSAIAGIFSVF